MTHHFLIEMKNNSVKDILSETNIAGVE